MSYAPTLNASNPFRAGPGVTIVFSSLAPGCTALSVQRTAGGRTMTVRGAARVSVAGAWGAFDPEAPFGIPSTYSAQMFDGDGNSLGFTSTASITIQSAKTWIHNPLNPAGAISVRVATATGTQVAAQIASNVYYPVGRAAGVAITGQRRGISNAPVTVYTNVDTDAAALDAMFGAVTGELTLPPFLCIRIASQMRIPLPRPLFLVVPSPTRSPVNGLAGGAITAWDLSGAEVDPPTPALAQTLLRRADVNAYYPTRAAFNAAYASRLAANTDYNLAGYAG